MLNKGVFRCVDATWADALLRACHDTYVDELFTESAEELIAQFIARCGGSSAEHLQRGLYEGLEMFRDRTFALFALGYLELPESAELVRPFLEAADRQKQWASVIALGLCREPEVFERLCTMLLEGVEDEERLRHRDPYAWDWYLARRGTVALTLGAWGDPRALAPLQQALRLAWEQEKASHAREPGWHRLQDHVAYALGQMGAWDGLPTPAPSVPHRNIAMIYMVLGTLKIPPLDIFAGLAGEMFEHPDPFPEGRVYLRPRPYPLRVTFVDPAAVMHVLGEHFKLSESEQLGLVRTFSAALLERAQTAYRGQTKQRWSGTWL